jgi:hypothetical protein
MTKACAFRAGGACPRPVAGVLPKTGGACPRPVAGVLGKPGGGEEAVLGKPGGGAGARQATLNQTQEIKHWKSNLGNTNLEMKPLNVWKPNLENKNARVTQICALNRGGGGV